MALFVMVFFAIGEVFGGYVMGVTRDHLGNKMGTILQLMVFLIS